MAKVTNDFLKSVGAILLDREEQYGDPTKNFSDIAVGWTVILGVQVEPWQVALCMDWSKTCREIHGHKEDNLLDKFGYVEIVNRLRADT